MNSIAELLRAEHSKAQAEKIAHLVSDGTYSTDALMACFFSRDNLIAQRAAWSVSKLSDLNIALIWPYLERMVDNLQLPVHNAVRRNTIRIWQSIDIPEDLKGAIYGTCFEFLCSPSSPPAIRVFSMSVCTNIAMYHTHLAEELMMVIQDFSEASSAGFKSRARKEMKRLEKVSK